MTPLLDVILVMIALVLALGLVLWLPTRGSRDSRAGLGSALLTGGAISLAFFFLQRQDQLHQADVAKKQDAAQKLADQRQARAQQAISDRQTLQLTLTLQRDLVGVDLRHRSLASFDLARKDLSYADLRDAVLTGARLIDATLVQAKMDEANLAGADLTGVHAQQASFDGTDLSGAQLRESFLRGASFGMAGGRAADLKNAILVDDDLSSACLAHADLRGASLGGANLAGADLVGADLVGTKLERDGIPANLAGATLAGAKLDSNDLKYVPPAERVRGVAEGSVSPRMPNNSVSDRIIDVSDGDTIELQRRGWVQIIGINAPNLNQPFGSAAKVFLQSLVSHEPVVRYVLGPAPREIRPGNTGRYLAYVWLTDRRLLNSLMLTRGYAVRKSVWPETPRYRSVMNMAESTAKSAGLGVWSVCPQPS